MMKHYAYIYFLDPEKGKEIKEHAQSHTAYWQKMKLPRYKGGPFSDRSGGMIVFDTESILEAQKYAAGDPFKVEHLVKQHWIKEWTLID